MMGIVVLLDLISDSRARSDAVSASGFFVPLSPAAAAAARRRAPLALVEGPVRLVGREFAEQGEWRRFFRVGMMLNSTINRNRAS